ncbi:MAG: RluA family pseudouridine synthase [Patescibacteria group bacterium]|nr:RluA family pseudouridine synthase [Patescibacteria group bacterium]
MIFTNLIPKIIYEDADILVLNKPAGLTVDRASTNKNDYTLQDWLDNYFYRQTKLNKLDYNSSDFESRSGIVHRLDKETSGLLIIAKTKDAFSNLQSQFKNREIIKKYLALVHGKAEPSKGTINVPIERNPFNKKKFGVFLGGKEAETEYRVISYYNFPDLRSHSTSDVESFSLLEVYPHTGRTHQIRVHLKYINHPVAGDILYSGRKNIQLDKMISSRIFLHAAYLKIRHPVTNKEREFGCELPKELNQILKKLKINPINQYPTPKSTINTNITNNQIIGNC